MVEERELTWVEKEVKRKLGMDAYSCVRCRAGDHAGCYGICDCYKLHMGVKERT